MKILKAILGVVPFLVKLFPSLGPAGRLADRIKKTKPVNFRRDKKKNA